MKTVRSLFHRLYNLFHKAQLDRDLSDELAAHLEMHPRTTSARAWAWDEARRGALIQLSAAWSRRKNPCVTAGACRCFIGMALGAERGQILRLVIAHGLKLTLTGMVLGILGGLALARFMRNLLFGASATDPLTFAMVGGVLMFVAVAACCIPARRATRVDPMIALRYE